MADDKKKKKEQSAADVIYEAYEKAAEAGYLGAKAQVSVGEKKKKRAK